MWLRTLVGAGSLLLLVLPTFASDKKAVSGVFRSDADANGVTEEWTITGDPTFWKIEIKFLNKDTKEIGHGHAATFSREGKARELNFALEMDQKPDDSWPAFPRGQLVLDETDNDKATFKFQYRKKEIAAGELHRQKK